MREAFGTTWTFQLMVIFILIFSAFLSVVITYSRAYTLKNQAMSIIEKYEGVTEESAEIINNYLYQNAYKTTSKCPEGWIGALNLNTTSIDGNFELASPNQEYYYCFKENINRTENSVGKITNQTVYYDFQLFFKFNLPVVGDIATFKVSGQSNDFIGSDDRISK